MNAMISLRRLLVPIDFSPLAEQAVEAAIALARGQSAEILLLHVQEESVDHYGFAGGMRVLEMQNRIETIIRQQMDRFADRVQGHGVAVRCYVRQGQPFAEIDKLARESDVDLIVLTTHGRGGLEHAFLGSTTERVVRAAPCSVFVVRGKGRPGDTP